MKNWSALALSIPLSLFISSAAAADPPLSGLKLWLKADAITGLNSGDKVAVWNDASTAANHAGNPSVENQPTWIANALNTQPVVRFADGNNATNAGQFLDTTSSINANRTPLTVLIVFQSEVSATARDTLLQPLDDGANAGRTMLYLQNDGAAEYRVATASSQGGGPAMRPYRPGAWNVVTLAQDPGTELVQFWRDGQPDGSAPLGSNTQPNGPWRIGDNKPRTGGLQGAIAEILVYESVLGEVERVAAEQYLMIKYGLIPLETVNLFRDNFNVTAQSNDVNFENGLGRQSGKTGALTYAENTSGANDAFSQVSAADAPGMLRLEVTGAQVYTAVTPNHNFNEGGNFSIDFDLDAGINDPAGASDDWACVVLGASSPLAFVNASDGVGILFRNNGAIQVFDGTAATGGGGQLALGKVHVRIEVMAEGFQGTPAVVRMFVDGTQIQLGTSAQELVKTAGFRGNFITLGGYAAAGKTWVHAFDNLMISAVPCIQPSIGQIKSYSGQTNQAVTVTIPPVLNGVSAAAVVVTSSDPTVARALGAVDGALTLSFPAGGSISQTFAVEAVSKGSAVLSFTGPSGACVGGTVTVSVDGSLIANPSFEENFNASWPHYSGINQWTQIPGGNNGVNDATGPFHDNGAIPDRGYVGLNQGNGGISQALTGLHPGQQYWLQFRYNKRTGGAMGLITRFGGVEIDNISSMPTVGGSNPYHYRQVVFTPTNDSGVLEFVTIPGGDATVLLDAVTMVPRGTNQVKVWNPSFEASGDVPSPGGIAPAPISGWIATGDYGINRVGRDYASVGINPDQDHVLYMRGLSSVSQTISNLAVGQEYQVAFSVSAAETEFPALRVMMGEDYLFEENVYSQGPGLAYRRVTNFWVATSGEAVLKFEQFDDLGGAVLIDDVQVIGMALPAVETKVSASKFDLFNGQPMGPSTVTVSIPVFLVVTQAVDIIITSSDPGIVIPENATNGTLVIHLPAGVSNTVTFALNALRPGTVSFLVTNNINCPGATFTVRNRSAFVMNPSFEDNGSDVWPGYAPIDDWQGASGLNPITVDHANGRSPFADNGTIPDRGQVALMQGENSLRQVIYGLNTNKQYWLQVSLNARNCCGDFPSVAAFFNGVELGAMDTVSAVGGSNPYHFVTVPFVPNSPTGLLSIVSRPTAANGDRTLLIDAVTIVQRDAGQMPVKNPSFEASGTPVAPGYVSPQQMAGWTGSGSFGVNIVGSGPFADNGAAVDQDHVAFLQDQGSTLSQTVSGLTAGARYTLSYAYNAQIGSYPELNVSVDGVMVHDEVFTAVEGANPFYTTNITLTAQSESMSIVFSQIAPGSNTVLLDNVKLAAEAVPVASLNILLNKQDNYLRISWPTSVGDAWSLQSCTALGQSWSNKGWPVTTENNEYVVYDTWTGGNQFYRLNK